MKRRILNAAGLVVLCLLAVGSPAAAQLSASWCPGTGSCDDGLFCNGREACSAGDCQPGPEPCPGRACEESLDLCLPGKAPKLEGGWVDVGGDPTVVLLANSYDRPVVVAGVEYGPKDPPLVVRIRQLTTDSLELYLQNPSGKRAPTRRVSYLVVEEGAWEVAGHRFEARRLASTVTDREGSMVGEAISFLQAYRSPVVVGQVMSARDEAWSVFWAGDQTSQRAPSWTAMRTGKTVGADPAPVRDEEVLGLVVFEADHGRIGAATFEAGVTGAAVEGMENSVFSPKKLPYRQLFTETFDRNPAIALAGIAGLSDPDAGWAVVAGGPDSRTESVSASGLQLAIDEDQLGDTERQHGAERVAYLVFDRPFSFQENPTTPQGITYPGGSEYYSCRLDQSVLDAACSNALPGIEQDIAACEQAVDNCASFVDLAFACGSCLSPIPDWKKLPLLAFLLCVPQCELGLLDFFLCRHLANSVLRTVVDLDICDICGGTDCGNRYGIDVNVDGLRCDEALATMVQCDSDDAPTPLLVNYVNPNQTLPGWCPYPDHWEVEISEVLDLNDYSMERECTPVRHTGPPGLNNNVQASFDCTCSGADCGDDNQTVPLVADVSCMPVNSWFKLRTTVTNACGEPVDERTVRVDYSSPPVTQFNVGIDARPGDHVSSLVIQHSQGATCFNETDIDSTVPTGSGGPFSVARIRCRDDVGTGGCDAVQLTGQAGGEGLDVRPNGVTVNLSAGGSSETKTVTSSGSFPFQSTALPGQGYSVGVEDPVYSFGANNEMKSLCWQQGQASGTVPSGGNSFQVADINCSLETLMPPIIPEQRPVPDPFDWDWGFDCDLVCDPNPPGGGSGGLEPCAPCTYCYNSSTDTCDEPCYCETVDVPGGECNLECFEFFTYSPSLAVTAGAARSTSGELKSDDVLKVSANAADADGLQGFMLAVDGVYEDHVMTSGTSGAFSNLAIDTSALPAGDHTLRVIALDALDSAPTPVFVDLPFEVDHTADPCQGDTSLPSVTLTAPGGGANLDSGTVSIQAQASDAGVGVKHVQFWAGGDYLGLDSTSPYTRTWTATPGTHVIKARAVDHCDNSRDHQVTVTVIDPCSGAPAPTVDITNYEDDQWVDPDLFYFEADAQDASGTGIDRVEFEVASFSNVAVDETPPYVSTGWHLLTERDEIVTARAFDGCGRVASDTITLHVNENSSVCGIDGNPPWAGVSTPAEGAVLPAGPVTIRADAADDGVLLAAVLEIDGALVPNSTILSSNPADYVWTWDATPGPHVVRIKVVDVCWKIGWSLPRSVTVQ